MRESESLASQNHTRNAASGRKGRRAYAPEGSGNADVEIVKPNSALRGLEGLDEEKS